MMDFIVDSTFWRIFSLLAYEIGSLIKRKWNWAIFNPLLIAIVLVIAVLSVFPY